MIGMKLYKVVVPFLQKICKQYEEGINFVNHELTVNCLIREINPLAKQILFDKGQLFKSCP